MQKYNYKYTCRYFPPKGGLFPSPQWVVKQWSAESWLQKNPNTNAHAEIQIQRHMQKYKYRCTCRYYKNWLSTQGRPLSLSAVGGQAVVGWKVTSEKSKYKYTCRNTNTNTLAEIEKHTLFPMSFSENHQCHHALVIIIRTQKCTMDSVSMWSNIFHMCPSLLGLNTINKNSWMKCWRQAMMFAMHQFVLADYCS